MTDYTVKTRRGEPPSHIQTKGSGNDAQPKHLDRGWSSRGRCGDRRGRPRRLRWRRWRWRLLEPKPGRASAAWVELDPGGAPRRWAARFTSRPPAERLTVSRSPRGAG